MLASVKLPQARVKRRIFVDHEPRITAQKESAKCERLPDDPPRGRCPARCQSAASFPPFPVGSSRDRFPAERLFPVRHEPARRRHNAARYSFGRSAAAQRYCNEPFVTVPAPSRKAPCRGAAADPGHSRAELPPAAQQQAPPRRDTSRGSVRMRQAANGSQP